MRNYSIIIPAYNEEAFIADSMNSVLNQSYSHSNLEIIVANNASIDNTKKIVSDFDSRGIAKRVLDVTIKGVSRAKNEGAKAANGDVFIFLDADSVMERTLVEKINEHYDKSPAGMITMVSRENILFAKLLWKFVEIGKTYSSIPTGMCYCDRELFFKAEGFNESYHAGEDGDFLIKVKKIMKKEGYKMGHIKDSYIATSSRRFESLPFKLGYPKILFIWSLSLLPYFRKKY